MAVNNRPIDTDTSRWPRKVWDGMGWDGKREENPITLLLLRIATKKGRDKNKGRETKKKKVSLLSRTNSPLLDYYFNR